ncbi:thiamine diphosphokinase [Vagococcus vulneris]|uniref:Thiamine diphosphokinase n=1 Tax=Vagococcus vulneris TaxID=1977869 RepID=A0A429ZXH4_9ENTE|nr:thiamine diphosphokinase [Vagococcus vulneris]RST98564.1 thiamine diphosphokinase [Vagococcus vulneris]
MIKQVVIIAGGDPELWPDLSPYALEETVWIGVDRGTLFGLEHGFPIERAVGDFDSLSDEEWQKIRRYIPKIEKCHVEKDDTDTQLGLLAAIEDYPKANYILIGATGGRLDHLLANLWLPMQTRFQSFLGQLFIKDSLNSVSYYRSGEYTIQKESDKTYLAYICLTEVVGLTLYDAKYTLDKAYFPLPFSLSSNEFVGDTSRFSFDDGFLAVIQSKDDEQAKRD